MKELSKSKIFHNLPWRTRFYGNPKLFFLNLILYLRNIMNINYTFFENISTYFNFILTLYNTYYILRILVTKIKPSRGLVKTKFPSVEQSVQSATTVSWFQIRITLLVLYNLILTLLEIMNIWIAISAQIWGIIFEQVPRMNFITVVSLILIHRIICIISLYIFHLIV